MNHATESSYMTRALELAKRGEGFVEPNPMVGCVIVRQGEIVGEGWHRRFGGPHAEVEALSMAGAAARGATMFVTLEPCCHHGKTPPCTEAILAAGIGRVIAAQYDPFPEVDGGGMRRLLESGVAVEVGLLEEQARRLNAPYRTLVHAGRPWVIAKWAMTLDGKIATRTGDSRWISNADSRTLVHQLRGRMDGVLIGRGTAVADDPLLTARPPGSRIATRIVLDSTGSLSLDSQLVKTSHEAPVLIVVTDAALRERTEQLQARGCEVLTVTGETRVEQVRQLLEELRRRRFTNVLVEGGREVLGTFCDAEAIDEVHAFIAPKLIGGREAPSPLGGQGRESIVDALPLTDVCVSEVAGDIYLRGMVRR